MAQSIVNNAEFRKLLTRKEGALGSELQAFTNRAFVYSLWSLRCMMTDAHPFLYSQKEGRETRYFLRTAKQDEAAQNKATMSKPAKKAGKKAAPIAANANAADEPAAAAC